MTATKLVMTVKHLKD